MTNIFYSIVMLVVLLMGVGALSGGVRLLLAGDPNLAGAITAVVMGTFLSGLGITYFYWFFLRRPIEAARIARARKLHPGQPWMERADWASRKLTSSDWWTALLTWGWTIAWCGAFGLIAIVNREKILASADPIWLQLLFGAMVAGGGLVGLTFAVAFSKHVHRFGTSVLVLETLPAFMGERFAGRLTARLEPQPRKPLDVELVCEEVQWVQTGFGKNRRSVCRVRSLGRTKTEVDTSRFIRSKAEATAKIVIDVPDGLPSSFVDHEGNGIRWWLRVSTSDPEVPFSAEFEVPVFERKSG